MARQASRWPIPMATSSGSRSWHRPDGAAHSIALRSADVGQGCRKRLDRVRVVRGAQVHDADVGAGVTPAFDRRLQLARVLTGVQAHVHRSLDLVRIAPDVRAVRIEHLALATPLSDVTQGR